MENKRFEPMKIVIGLGYGDEGKGLTTSYLCSRTSSPMVVRFNGGHQAGHTVVVDGVRHVFSSFGAGTLQGVPTYWSKYCTFFPTAVVNEYNVLQLSHNYTPGGDSKPQLFVHPLCPVTTPYDLYANQASEKKQKHGSVGVGFGTTLKRHESFYKLFVQDLFYPQILQAKLDNICSYYGFDLADSIMEDYMKDIEEVKELITVSDESILKSYNLIMEGAQGVLLDQDFGFFPNVTRSNTTTKNAMEINNEHLKETTEIFYVTRSYQTRHGNGFMSHEDPKLPLINNEKETNISHAFQGNFRVGKLDVDMLNYALESDNHFSSEHLIRSKKNLVITCTDQYPIDVEALLSKLKIRFDKVFISKGDSYTDIELHKQEEYSILHS